MTPEPFGPLCTSKRRAQSPDWRTLQPCKAGSKTLKNSSNSLAPIQWKPIEKDIFFGNNRSKSQCILLWLGLHMYIHLIYHPCMQFGMSQVWVEEISHANSRFGFGAHIESNNASVVGTARKQDRLGPWLGPNIEVLAWSSMILFLTFSSLSLLLWLLVNVRIRQVVLHMYESSILNCLEKSIDVCL